jgi:hypothetical protein
VDTYYSQLEADDHYGHEIDGINELEAFLDRESDEQSDEETII